MSASARVPTSCPKSGSAVAHRARIAGTIASLLGAPMRVWMWATAVVGLLAGCSGPDAEVTQADGVTFHRDVAPVLADRCGACHQAGGIAPFAVDDYATVETWGPAI